MNNGELTTQRNREELNAAVRAHEISRAVDWKLRKEAEILHRWFDIFNDVYFDGVLPVCFLQIDDAHITSLGHYRPGLNCVGAQHEININRRHLERPLYQLLATLLHEMTHEWEALYGKPGKRNYHTKRFTTKCAEMGIPCTGGYRSVTIGYVDPFISLLRKHDIEVIEQQPLSAAEVSPRLKGKSTLILRMCGCTRIRAAVEVQATCNRCQQVFHKVE